MKTTLSFFSLVAVLLLPFVLVGQSKQGTAVRTHERIEIDGMLNEPAWTTSHVMTGFSQYKPVYDVKASFETEVRILYNDEALYIGAVMYDPHPDSILAQLGERDSENLNTDYFTIEFDTYGSATDSYLFTVTAAGVQIENRLTDETFDAVWICRTVINDEGWIAEIEIPYAAIRFPRKSEHEWAIQLSRGIRRFRETDQWVLEVKGAANDIINWGKLTGISDVKAPVRLSLTPYLSAGLEHYPYNINGRSNFSYSVSGGMDLKYGLNESFTLDVSLLPDFSQVKSDNIIKNLSAFEVSYDEQRPFFQEAVDLFQKGNLFYSRRIAGVPAGYYMVQDKLKEGEEVESNPATAHLLNAVKFSGRNKNGMAVGLLNAVTDNTRARLIDSLGRERAVLTEPFTNYNILVFDQSLRNNGSTYLINTSVLRDGHARRANVTGAGITLHDASNLYGLTIGGAVSQVYNYNELKSEYEGDYGYKYELSLGKISGNWQYSLTHNLMNDRFDANDLGITRRNSQIVNKLLVSYSIFEPFWRLRDMETTIEVYNSLHYLTTKNENLTLTLRGYGTDRGYTSYWGSLSWAPLETYDFYEPRVAGRFFVLPGFINGSFSFSSDYRKPFALDGDIAYTSSTDGSSDYNFELSPIVRVDNYLSFTYELIFSGRGNDRGFAAFDSTGKSIFGRRTVSGIENSLNAAYVFRNNLSLKMWARHYWYKGVYDQYFLLREDGYLDATSVDYNADFNFNSFNIDLSFCWEFAPGSNVSLVWKNALVTEDQEVARSFFDNVSRTFKQPQLNNLSLKILYYLDYQNARQWFRRSNS